MILSLSLPRVNEQMQSGLVHKVLARTGEPLRPGTPLLEIRVDLGASMAQDCPPQLFFRLLATERGHLRSLSAAVGDILSPGAALGVATTTPDEGVEGPAGRALRTTLVAIQVDPLSR